MSRGALALGVVLLTLVACSGSANKPSSAGTSGTLIWDKSFDIKTVDPDRSNEVTGSAVVKAMYDTLVTFRGADVTKVTPLLASSYDASADAKTFTFHLRKDAKFSDGTTVTAQDAAFSFNRLKNIKGIPSFRMNGLTVTAPDPLTVVVQADQPNPAVPSLLTGPNFAVLNSKVVTANGGTDAVGADKNDKAQAYLDKQSAGSGPYLLDSFEVTTRVALKANPSYWGNPKPGYAQIVLENVPAATQLLNVQKGEAQLALDLSPDQVSGIDTTKIKVAQQPSITFFFLYTNESPTISKIASDKNFQEAVRYAIDYQGIVNLVGHGAIQSPGVVPSMLPGHLSAGDVPKRDLNRAKAALAKGNFTNPVVPLEYPSDFTLNGQSFGTIAQKIQADLKEAGITINLTPGPLATTLANWRAGKEQMGLWTTTGLPDPSQALIFCPGGVQSLRANWPTGSDPKIEAACTKASTVVTPSERVTAYQQMQKELNEAGPYFPLFQPAQVLVSAKNVTNVDYAPGWLVDLAVIGHK